MDDSTTSEYPPSTMQSIGNHVQVEITIRGEATLAHSQSPQELAHILFSKWAAEGRNVKTVKVNNEEYRFADSKPEPPQPSPDLRTDNFFSAQELPQTSPPQNQQAALLRTQSTTAVNSSEISQRAIRLRKRLARKSDTTTKEAPNGFAREQEAFQCRKRRNGKNRAQGKPGSRMERKVVSTQQSSSWPTTKTSAQPQENGAPKEVHMRHDFEQSFMTDRIKKEGIVSALTPKPGALRNKAQRRKKVDWNRWNRARDLSDSKKLDLITADLEKALLATPENDDQTNP